MVSLSYFNYGIEATIGSITTVSAAIQEGLRFSSCIISLITLIRSIFPPSPADKVLLRDPPPVIIFVSPIALGIMSELEIGETGPKLIWSEGI
jgi:hypothetical protein